MSKRIKNSSYRRKGIVSDGDVVIDTPATLQTQQEKVIPLSEEIMNAPFLTDVETGEIIRPIEVKTFATKKEPEFNIEDSEVYNIQEAISPDFSIVDGDTPSTYAWGDVSASGTYVRSAIKGPWIIGDRRLRYEVRFWTSSSSVYNNDGNDVKIHFSWDGGSASYVITTRWGTLGSWTGNYDWTLPSGKSYAYAWASTNDRAWDSRFSATTAKILMYQGTFSATISARGQTWNDYEMTYRSVESEDFALQRPDGAYDIARPNVTGSGGSKFGWRMNMPHNSAYSRTYGQIPDGGSGSSPWVWGYKSINIATTYTNVTMPTVTASRSSSDPSVMNVSWTAGGTTYKPQGNATRTGYIFIKSTDGGTTYSNKVVNLEAAGSTTLSGVPLDKQVVVFASYNTKNLSPSDIWQEGGRATVDPAFTARVKVGGAYKTSTEAYVKVSGSYKRIAEAWVKVGGVYKRIV